MALLDWLYPKIFIAIVEVNERRYNVVLRSSFRGSEQEEQRKTFTSFASLDEYIATLKSESPYYYVALLNPARDQGALPTCSKVAMREFSDIALLQSVCVENRWSVFSSSAEIKESMHKYDDFGLDYLYSPFLILHRVFGDKIGDERVTMFVLIQEQSVAVAIFRADDLKFAFYGITDEDEVALFAEEDALQEDLSLDEELFEEDMDDSLDLEDLDGLDDIGSLDEIETLDDIEEIESFEELDDVIEEDIETQEQKSDSLENYNIDYYRFTLIQDALKIFYGDKRYDQAFVEALFIADSAECSADLRNYLEEELFMQPIIRRIDLGEELMALMLDEVNR